LKEVDSLALADTRLDLYRAFKDFFEGRAGFPHFKSKKTARFSYRTDVVNNNLRVEDDSHIRFPKVGTVKAVIHRLPEEDWKLKSATVSMERDGTYYVSMLYEYEADIQTVAVDIAKAVGFDYKSDGLLTSSDGKTVGSPKYYRKGLKKQAKLQRQLSRKTGSQKGDTPSKNYLKAKRKYAKHAHHVANQRKDFLHKLSREITNRYDIVCVEDLDFKAMSNKGFGNGKATLDNGAGMLYRFLEYKLDRGKDIPESR